MHTKVEEAQVGVYCDFMLAVSRKMRQFSDCYQGSCHLSRTEFTLICALEQQGPMMMKDLNAQLNEEVSLSTLTRLIDRLEADGYVRRATNPGDRRCFMISLTDKANALLQGHPRQMEQLAADMLACLNTNEQQDLLQLIYKMKHQLDKGGAANEARPVTV